MLRARETGAGVVHLPLRPRAHAARDQGGAGRRWTATATAARWELSDARVDVMGYACLVAIMSRATATTAVRAAPAPASPPRTAPTCRSSPAPAPWSRGMPRARRLAGRDRHAVHEAADRAGGRVHEAEESRWWTPLASRSRTTSRWRQPRPGGAGGDRGTRSCRGPTRSSSRPACRCPRCRRSGGQKTIGLPVLSASVATAYEVLDRLGLEPVVPDAGALLPAVSSRRRSSAADEPTAGPHRPPTSTSQALRCRF